MPDGMQQLGTQLAEALAPRRSDLVTVSYGTVKAVNETSTDVRLDVDLHGGTLYGLPMTTACKGVAVGGRVIVQTYGHLSTVTGVIAHDNGHYVNPQPMEFQTADTGNPADVISVYGMVYGTDDAGYFASLNVNFVNDGAYTQKAWGELVIATAVGWRTVVDQAVAVAVENLPASSLGTQFFEFHGSTIGYRSCVQTVIEAGAWHKACIVAPVEPV